MADLTTGGASVPGFLWPGLVVPSYIGAPSLNNSLIVNNGTRYITLPGRVRWADGGTHNIATVGLRMGPCADGTGSTFELSLQDMSLTAGPPQGDGTADQICNTNPVTNAWNEFALGTTRANVAHGALLCVTLRYSTYGSGSSFYVAFLNNDGTACRNVIGGSSYGIFTTYYSELSQGAHTVLFKSDDATPVLGSFESATPIRAVNVHTFNNASNPKVHACAITTQMEYVVDSLWGLSTAAYNFDIVLYNNAGTVIAYAPVDKDTVSTAGYFFQCPIAPQTIPAGDYYVGLRPTTTSSISGYSVDVYDASYLNLLPGGADCSYATLSSGDVWSARTATRRFMAGLHVVGVSTGGGGGLITHPGMSGGLNG